MSLSPERKTRARASWEDRFSGRMDGVIDFEASSWPIPAEHEEVSK